MDTIKVKNPKTGEVKAFVKSPDGKMVEVKATSNFNEDPASKLLNLPGKDHMKFVSGYSQVDAGKEFAERQAKNKELDYQRTLALRGPEAQKRAEVAENTPWYEKMGRLAMDELYLEAMFLLILILMYLFQLAY